MPQHCRLIVNGSVIKVKLLPVDELELENEIMQKKKKNSNNNKSKLKNSYWNYMN